MGLFPSAVCSACLEAVSPERARVGADGGIYCGAICEAARVTALPRGISSAGGPRRVRVCFNSALVALGTADTYRGPFAVREEMVVTGDPTGKSYTALRVERSSEIRATLRDRRRRESREATV